LKGRVFIWIVCLRRRVEPRITKIGYLSGKVVEGRYAFADGQMRAQRVKNSSGHQESIFSEGCREG
jgi:hypothetical protein